MDAASPGPSLYVPPHFAADDVREVQAFIGRVGLCTLITLGAEIDASLIPIVLHPDEGPYGTLRGHLARPNRQLDRRRPDVRALAVFQGPAHYITPSWYETKRRTAKVVPTYDYAIAQARGFVRIIDDPDRMREHLAQLTAEHEATVAGDWQLSDAPHDYIDTMMRGITAFELRIDELVGKWKLSQNRPADDIDGVVNGLSALESDAARTVAKLVDEARRG
jgi:transcriptional regulator